MRVFNVSQIYPLSLYDTDNDGYGDLRGITEKLDHIASLQVETVWLTPIYESPMKDFGYDVSNYLAINPVFGNEEDFQSLVTRVHELNMKIIMDFVPNHSSINSRYTNRKEKLFENQNFHVVLKGAFSSKNR